MYSVLYADNSIVLMTLSVFVFFLAEDNQRYLKKTYEQSAVEYQNKILSKQVEEINNIYLTMRGWRHDYHNHMQKLKAHISLQQINEIKEYLNSGIKTENTGDIVNGPLWNDGVNEAAETYTPPKLKVGDAVLIGKFKNRKAEIKGFDTDDHGQPVLKTTKGDQKLFKPRIPKLDKIDEVLNHVKRKWML